jgi:hypothetical protein
MDWPSFKFAMEPPGHILENVFLLAHLRPGQDSIAWGRVTRWERVTHSVTNPYVLSQQKGVMEPERSFIGERPLWDSVLNPLSSLSP